MLARKPAAAELAHLVELYRENLERYRGDPTAAKAMAGRGVIAVSSAGCAGESKYAELAAWTVVANVLLNLDETLTKG